MSKGEKVLLLISIINVQLVYLEIAHDNWRWGKFFAARINDHWADILILIMQWLKNAILACYIKIFYFSMVLSTMQNQKSSRWPFFLPQFRYTPTDGELTAAGDQLLLMGRPTHGEGYVIKNYEATKKSKRLITS